MQTILSPRLTSRASRSNTISEVPSKKQIQRSDRVFRRHSLSVNNANYNRKLNNVKVINGQSLLNIRSIQTQKDQEKKKSLSNDRIIINVCGDRYETHRTTLELYPDTLLGNHKRRKYYYDKNRKEYFFDRHRACFQAILYYYQSHGRLRRPEHVSLDIFLEEVTFFQLGHGALEQIRKDENIEEVKKVRLPKNRFRRYIWATLEYPDYSLIAKIVNIISLTMVLLSTILLAVQSLPQYDDYDDLACPQQQNTVTNTLYINNNTDQSSSQRLSTCSWYYTSPFFLIQAIVIGCFTIEFFARILSTPSLLDFIKGPMNWIDLLAIIPFYITLGIRLTDQAKGINENTYAGLRFLRVLRLARVFKFYRVFKHVKTLRVLATTIKQSLPDFFIMISLLTLLGFLFGAAAYYAENSSNGEQFDSIFKGTYWGIITITTVGYGDMAPTTVIGRFIACMCALFGTATVGILVSVLVDRYQRVYARKLFIKEEPIDFHDYSDDENNDTDSRELSYSIGRQTNMKIEDPDARAKENAVNDNNINNNISENLEIPYSPIVPEENPRSRNTSSIHFIIGYVDDENQKTSHDLVEKISSIVADKRTSGDNISLHIISNANAPEASPYDVQFNIASSSEEEEDDDILTEINGSRSKGNVLKTFQRPLSEIYDESNNLEMNI